IAYFKIRYRGQKAVYLGKDERLAAADPSGAWHFAAFDFPRTVFEETRIMYNDRRAVIFPRVDKSELSRFEGDEIIVLGKLIGRKRPFFSHKGFALVVAAIGYTDKDGTLSWIRLNEL
ncbi:MAG: hypothetical protein JW994_00265, partial [Candidatus Omnitrophica bacterium]|nr:hypothetical protein [Candidatus Omnitrophota bacterium]